MSVVTVPPVAMVGFAVCVHCGHAMHDHGRRQSLTVIHYRCHGIDCGCEYDLLYVE